jgi:hypothetical protein
MPPASVLEPSNALENRDYVVMIARTAPSVAQVPPGYEHRWRAAHQAILELAQRCESFDPDGISVYISCKSRDGFELYRKVVSERLTQIFDLHYPPQELSLLDGLNAELADYFARKAAGQTKANGEAIIVLIDGEPRERMAIAKAIAEATQKLDQAEELRIGLVQIGDDLIARGFLEALDQNLRSATENAFGARFDIVTTQVLAEVSSNCLTEFLSNLVAN